MTCCARAFALNFTAVPKTVLSYFSAWPGGSDPFISVMNSNDGRTLANHVTVKKFGMKFASVDGEIRKMD